MPWCSTKRWYWCGPSSDNSCFACSIHLVVRDLRWELWEWSQQLWNLVSGLQFLRGSAQIHAKFPPNETKLLMRLGGGGVWRIGIAPWLDMWFFTIYSFLSNLLFIWGNSSIDFVLATGHESDVEIYKAEILFIEYIIHQNVECSFHAYNNYVHVFPIPFDQNMSTWSLGVCPPNMCSSEQTWLRMPKAIVETKSLQIQSTWMQRYICLWSRFLRHRFLHHR